jgi:hypothetical protein
VFKIDTKEDAGLLLVVDDIQNSQFNCLTSITGRCKTIRSIIPCRLKDVKDVERYTLSGTKASAGNNELRLDP